MEYNDEITRQFYGNVQTVVNNWLLFDGMSIGVADTIANEETYVSIRKHLKEATETVRCVSVELIICNHRLVFGLQWNHSGSAAG